MQTIDTILPAGGRIHGAFEHEAGVSLKCMIVIDGSTLLERGISAARGTESVRRIVVIGPDEIASHPASARVDSTLPEGATGPDNIRAGLQWLTKYGDSADRVLILTTDLPFVTSPAISEFLERCPADADLCVPVYTKREFMAAFPGCTARFVRLKSGEWTTGCAFLVNPSALEANWHHIEKVFAARKNQLSMARLLGAMTIVRLAARRLDIHHVEARCRKILGCTGVAVTGCDPSLAFDIDERSDYRFALEHSANHRRQAICGAVG